MGNLLQALLVQIVMKQESVILEGQMDRSMYGKTEAVKELFKFIKMALSLL